MSLLIEALQRAESAQARDAAPAADTAATPKSEVVDQKRLSARALLEATEAPQRATRARLARLGGYGALGALLVAVAGWWWLNVPTAPMAPLAQAPADERQPPAQPAPDQTVQPPAPQAPPQTDAAAIAVPTEVRPAQARRGIAPRRAALAPAPAMPAKEDHTVAAPPASLVRKGTPVEPPLVAAYAALQTQRIEEAERLYRAALEIDPRQPDALLGLAAIAERRGANAEAIALYRQVLTIERDHPVALAALAELSAGGDTGPQESVLRQALARRPASAALHAALGRLLAARERWSEAQQCFASAWELEPASALRAYDLAVALDRLRKSEAAAAMYARALAQAGDAPGFDVDAARARLQALQSHLSAPR